MSEAMFGSLINQPGKILVVDDEEINRTLLREVLAEQGHEVVEAEDGNQALERFSQHSPDLVLLDVMMPGLNGFRVCGEWKKNPALAPVPVILLTGLDDRQSRLAGLSAGANDLVTKPIDVEEVLLRVRNSLYYYRLYRRLESANDELRSAQRCQDAAAALLAEGSGSPLRAAEEALAALRTALTSAAGPDAAGPSH
jgi:DNA-binding response OmpR family regulator